MRKCITAIVIAISILVPGMGKRCAAQDAPRDSVHELPEVTVRARHDNRPATVTATTIGTASMRAALGASLSELIAHTSGISTIASGATASVPVLHGMYGCRLPIIQNGARLAGQQWGVEHEPEVDIESNHSVTVIKGADALRYACDALGGAIIVEQRPLPYARPGYLGRVATGYESNGRTYTLATEHEGCFSRCPEWAWRISAHYGNGGDRTTARYLLNNTGTRELHWGGSVGREKGRFRIEAGFNRYDHLSGIMLGASIGSEDILRERLALGRPLYTEPYSRHIDYPKERVIHYTARLRASYQTTCYGTFSWQSVLQHNNRREWAIRRAERSSIPEMSLRLTDQRHRLDWEYTKGKHHSEAGTFFSFAENHSVTGTGVVPVIPNYTESCFGSFASYRYTLDKVTLSTGIRLEGRHTEAAGYDITGHRYGGGKSYFALGAGAGMAWAPTPHWSFTAHLGYGTRTPNVYERYSNGNNLAAGIYLLGKPDMNPERSLKCIASLAYRSERLSLSADAYWQHIHDYIYDAPTGEVITVLSGCYPLFRYQQTAATLYGMDADLSFAFTNWLSYKLSASLIRAKDLSAGRYLPFMPAPRLRQELSFSTQIGNSSLRFSVAHRFVAKQRYFDPASDLLPDTPPSYHLWSSSAEFGTPLPHGARLRLVLEGDNLLNKEYKEYTNRARYFTHERGRSLRGALIITF